MEMATQNNPLFKRAQEMSDGKSQEEIETIVRNICKEQGMDYNEIYKNFNDFIVKYK